MEKETPKCKRCRQPMQEQLMYTEIKAGKATERTIYVCRRCGLTKTV